MIQDFTIIGYSGHAYVCIENALENQFQVHGYCESIEKKNNPFQLKFLGNEVDFLTDKAQTIFIGVGNNKLREKIYHTYISNNFINLVHPKAVVSNSSTIASNSNILINAGVVVQAFSKIATGVILNTGCIIEHECEIGAFTHIAPGAVLAGNVKVGQRSFVGANAVIKQGVNIGNDVTIGAGSVVLHDIEDGVSVVGNPAKILIKNTK